MSLFGPHQPSSPVRNAALAALLRQQDRGTEEKKRIAALLRQGAPGEDSQTKRLKQNDSNEERRGAGTRRRLKQNE